MNDLIVMLPGRDVVVTTPKTQLQSSAAEADDCIRAGGGEYHRRLHSKPRECKPGSRLYYVENGFIVGFATIDKIYFEPCYFRCNTTEKMWRPGWYLRCQAYTWKWIAPIPMAGFQGFRYADFSRDSVQIIGGWLSKRPETAAV